MIWFLYYLIFSSLLSVLTILTFICINFTFKKFPKSKLANFFRKNFISDIDEEPYK